MESDSTRLIAAIIVLIGCSGFFSMSETALTSIGKLKVRALLDSHVKGAEALHRLKENPKKFLTAILIGNNFVNILASTLATVYASKLTNSMATAVSTGIMTFLILVFGEITPKTFATQHCEKISLLVAGPITFVQMLLTPLIIALNYITSLILKATGSISPESDALLTDAVIKTMADVGHEEGLLEQDERRMINNVVDFGDYEAKAVMTPRTKIVAVDVESTYADVLKIFKEERFSRLPVYEENIDNIIGVIYVKDLIFTDPAKEGFNIKELMREVYYTYESKSTFELFAIMRGKRYSMSVVLDEYGGTSGIISIEDLVEEIVGEITDEDDDLNDIEHIKDHEYTVEGGTRIDEVNEMLGTKLQSRNFDSIGGYVIESLGRFPAKGEKITADGITFEVGEVEKNRIDRLKITINSAPLE